MIDESNGWPAHTTKSDSGYNVVRMVMKEHEIDCF
jgi:hypothetical protein